MTPYIPPFRMADHLYFIGTQKASCHLIDTEEGLILIDTGYPNTGDDLIKAMNTLGFDVKDVKIILHSHGHGDHSGATPDLLKHCNAKTYLGKEDLRYISGFEPDEYFYDGQTVTLGSTEILCLATPGHTNGTFSFFWNVTDHGKTYRAGMFGGAGTRQLTKNFLLERGLYYFQRGDFFRSIERLEKIPVTMFVANHARQNHTYENAMELQKTGKNLFFRPEAWQEHLSQTRRAMEKVIQTEIREEFVNYAHRGASAYEPENTAASFRRGLEMGANGIETDVRLSKDGVPVLFHDKTLERVTGEEGEVLDYTWEEIQKFRVIHGEKKEPILSLEEFLKEFSQTQCKFAIELKAPGTAEKAAALIQKYDVEKRTVVTSFKMDYLKEMKEIFPTIKLGLLTKHTDPEILEEMKRVGIDQLCPKASDVTAELVDAWHREGFRVRAYGVTDEEKMKNAYEAGVDGMTVNFPDLLEKMRKEI